MNLLKYFTILALFFFNAFASEIEDLRVSNANVSIYKITDVSYHNVISYLNSSEIFSLSLSNKYFNKVVKEWIGIFLPKFSPKLQYFNDSKLKQLIFLFIILIFPGIDSIDADRAQNLNRFNLFKNNDLENQNIVKFKMKYAILGIIQILFDDSKENMMTVTFSDYECTPLIWASIYGNTEIARFFLEKGADVNATNINGYTALMEASKKGHTEIAALLIEKGANVYVADGAGFIALILASIFGYTEIVSIFLEYGVNVNFVTNEGDTALIWASKYGHNGTAALLIEKGANVNVASQYGWNALIWASVCGHDEISKLLIENGANVYVTNFYGYYSLIYTTCKGSSKKSIRSFKILIKNSVKWIFAALITIFIILRQKE